MVSDEAQVRKNRSITILKKEKVPFIEHLPPIETEAESIRRTTQQVTARAMALCIVSAKGEGLEQKIVDELIDEYHLALALTPKEKAFLENLNPTQHEIIQFNWRYECYWVLLWALAYIDKLERPDTVCDVELAVRLLQENGHDGFLKKASLRSQAEILDEADLIYRYHWAVRNAHRNDRDAPAGLDSGVVLERHYALNWLIGYMDEEWDDISTET